MKIILAKDIKKLGEAGSVVNVADGYARNYLLPKNLAILATKYNLSKVEAIVKEAEAEKLALESEYNVLVQKINEVTLTFHRKADENDHLFGSVSETDIVKALAEKEIEIHKSFINMDKHLKEIGSFEVVIEFTSAIKTVLKVNIEKE
ncbi:MAG: 50S ribosomal protein L9 [Candidatus Cloacimonadota bacterium]|nr:MAG: 50S ribosomal protein L9 [Candidatus Cloacimonadota bacterium]